MALIAQKHLFHLYAVIHPNIGFPDIPLNALSCQSNHVDFDRSEVLGHILRLDDLKDGLGVSGGLSRSLATNQY